MRKATLIGLAAILALGGCGLAKDEHGYPTVVKSNFVSACTKAGTTEQICNCAFGKIETRISYDKFREEDAKATAGKSVSPEFQQTMVSVVQECFAGK